MRTLLITLLFSHQLMAQHAEQPLPLQDNVEDMRQATVLFSIEDVREKRHYWLERTPALDHFLRLKKGSEEVLKKADSREAKKLDLSFAAGFLRCQYQLPTAPGNCQVVYKLNMKGEEQEICAKDDKKSQEIQAFLKELNKRF